MTDSGPGDYEVSELGPAIKDIDDLGELEETLQAEHHGQNCVPAVAPIEGCIEKFPEDEESTDADGLGLASMSTAEAGNALQSVEEASELESLLEREETGENRDPVK